MGLFDSIFAGESGLASTLLGTFGISAVLYKSSAVEYDPTSPFNNPNKTRTTVTISPILRYNSFERINSSIVEGDCRILGKPSEFKGVVEQSDYIVISGVKYSIVLIEPISSGDSNAILSIKLRLLK